MTGPTALFVHHGAYPSLGFIAEQAERRGFDVVAVDTPAPGLDPRDFALVTILGSPSAAYDDTVEWLPGELAFVGRAVRHDVPVFGICFGAQLLARSLGASLGPACAPELGWIRIHTDEPSIIEAGPWFEMHGDAFTLPPGAVELARNDVGVQAFQHGRSLGVQFHPEVDQALVEGWVQQAADFVASAGADPERVVKQTVTLVDEARVRAHRLFDRVWARIGN